MKKIIATLAVAIPSMALAQTQPITDVNSLSQKLIGLGNLFTVLLVALAVIFIIWNIVMFLIKGASDEESRKNAQHSIVWGIIGLAIIMSIWGLVNILMGTFRTTPGSNQIPQIQNVNNGNIPIVP